MVDERHPLPHPADFRLVIIATAVVAMATWWGLGLPYSLFAWLLDSQQLRWVLICYLWEVPVAGVLGPLLFPLYWFRAIERRWDRVFADPHAIDAADVADLEATILDFPLRVAKVFVITTLIGYGVGALQLRLFAQLPVVEIFKIAALGIVTGLVAALFAFLYLESRLAPLLRRLGAVRAVVPPAGRRVPLFEKVFACSLILTLSALLLLGTIFYSRGERLLEEQIGQRVLAEARYLAAQLAEEGTTRARDTYWWRSGEHRMQLGPSGYAYLIGNDGTIVAGSGEARDLHSEGLRPALVQQILSSGFNGSLVDRVYVDRVYTPRIVAVAPVGEPELKVVAIVHRREFAGELDGMLWRGGVVFAVSLLLALIQGFLFSRRLTRPIEVVTDMAGQIARAPGGSFESVPVRTNDEVGELATAFNQMTVRLEEARSALERHSAELERRVAEATRNIATLYDVTRTTTSTLEIEDVLELVAEKTRMALGLERLVVLWYPQESGGVVDAYAIAADGAGERLELEGSVDLAGLCGELRKAAVANRAALAAAVPSAIADRLGGGEWLCLPLVFKDQLLGIILAGIEGAPTPLDLELAEALANQAAAALANASLFETARRHGAELQRLSQMREQLQEESLRSLSRELHDGVGQVLTAVKMDLGSIERAQDLEAPALRSRLREVREQVTELLQEVRTMSQLLRPSMLDDFGLVPTLQWLVEKFAARTSLRVDLRTPPPETRLPPPIEVLFYRVTQEALTNVVNHAKARRVEVELALHDGQATLVIADDGIGFDVERFRRKPAVGGLGLLGMRERVAHYGGHIDIRSRPQAGVRITLTIPIERAGSADGGERGPLPLAG